MAEYNCNICGKSFTHKQSLNRHNRTHGDKHLICKMCGSGFNRMDHLKKHELTHVLTPTQLLPSTSDHVFKSAEPPSTSSNHFPCNICAKPFLYLKNMIRHRQSHSEHMLECVICQRQFHRTDLLKKHLNIHHAQTTIHRIPERTMAPMAHLDELNQLANEIISGGSRYNNQIIESEKLKLQQQVVALKGYLRSYHMQPKESYKDLELFLRDAKDLLMQVLSHEQGIKLWISVNVELERMDGDVDKAHFSTKQQILLAGTDKSSMIDYMLKRLIEKLENYSSNGSGWSYKNVLGGEVHLAVYKPLAGSSSFQRLPDWIRRKNCILNIQNNDNKCFLWSVLAALHPIDNDPDKQLKYSEFEHEIDMNGIEFPVSLDSIHKFEIQNKIAVNVYGIDQGKEVIPLYISETQFTQYVHLLLNKNHYSLIKNLDGLLYHIRSAGRKKYFCFKCLVPLYSEVKRDAHMKMCRNNKPTRTTMPTCNELKFKNIQNMQPAPYRIYADFECILKKIEGNTPDPSSSFINTRQRHTPCGYGLVDVFGCCENKIQIGDPIIYRGEDTVRHFLEKVIDLSEHHQNARINNQKTLNMKTNDWLDFDCSTQCYLCDKDLVAGDKVKDHCHLCGQYRGAAHWDCNIGYKLSRDVTVLFHNLRRYDGHLIMQQLGRVCEEKGLLIECIPKGLEDYLAFSIKRKGSRKRKRTNGTSTMIVDEADSEDEDEQSISWKIRFVDSIQFLPSSLDTLTENLKKHGVNSFKAMSAVFKDNINLMLRKGIYPYEYMDSWHRFEEPCLPEKHHFHSHLADSDISEENYQHAILVFQTMNLSNLGDYHDLYLKTDVLLLCDIFEHFRSFCMTMYKLDPLHYVTLPSFGWDACLKLTGVTLQLLQDPDMYSFFEEGIRGGVSVICHRHAKANNKYQDTYDPTLKSLFIMYLDANNLYGWSMIQKLPTAEFRFLDREEYISINWENIETEGNYGYVCEVDLEYPAHLHDLHNDYPLAPESLSVNNDMLSPYCSTLKADMSLISGNGKKLIPNLQPKSHYKVHFKNLQFYLKLGMELTYVHRVIKFKQSNWMNDYIMFNTNHRKNAKSSFEKDLFKLLNNAVFGKTMENVRNYVDVELVSNPARFRKLTSKPRYLQSRIFYDELVAVQSHRSTIELCKPVYVGFTVLELSKLLMYDFHYNYMKNKYMNDCKLLFTDTDSLCYAIECADIYKDMLSDQHMFDTSDYPETHQLFSNTNKKVVGKMKDETAGVIIDEFVGLRAKMYSIKCADEEKKRAKGVKKVVVTNSLKHSDYLDTLRNNTFRRDRMSMIRNDAHNLFTVEQNKVSLSAYDDKRFILDNGVASYAYGHYETV